MKRGRESWGKEERGEREREGERGRERGGEREALDRLYIKQCKQFETSPLRLYLRIGSFTATIPYLQ